VTTIRQHRIESDREYLSALLQRHSYNVSAAAREAGVMRTSLYNLLKLRGVRPSQGPSRSRFRRGLGGFADSTHREAL
jgi:DNA-binding NtrC family response regulator